MIKVNLLRSLKKKVASMNVPPGTVLQTSVHGSDNANVPLVGDSKQGLIKIIMILILPAIIWFYENDVKSTKVSVIKKQTNLLNKLRQENSKQDSLIKEIEKFKDEKTLLESQIRVIAKLSKGRGESIRIIAAVRDLMPEKAWLFSIGVDKKIGNIKGYAWSDDEVSQLISGLEKNIYFSNVNLKSSSEEKTDRGIIKQFEIVCRIEGIE